MKVYFIVLGCFLVAFAGLAAGLLLRRSGLRGGCHSAEEEGHDCQCATAETARPEQAECCSPTGTHPCCDASQHQERGQNNFLSPGGKGLR